MLKWSVRAAPISRARIDNALRKARGRWLDRKFPSSSRGWIWQYVFPSEQLSLDRRTGEPRRHHLDGSGLQKAVRQAAHAAGLDNRVTCHTFRYCLATHLLENHYDIRTVQELLGHKDVRTTMILPSSSSAAAWPPKGDSPLD